MAKKHRSLTPAAVLGAALLLAGCPSPCAAAVARDESERDSPAGAAAARSGARSAPAAPPAPPAAAAAAAREPSLARDPLAGRAGARLARARRHRRRLLDARPGAAHRAEQSAAMDRARTRAAVGKRRASGGDLRAQGAGARERRSRRASPGGRLLADALRAQGRNQEAQEVESRPYMH